MNTMSLTRNGITTVTVPLSFRRIGGRRVIVAPDGEQLRASPINVDNTMVKALARAFRWQRLLDRGKYATIAEIAVAEKINASYVSRVIRMTLLSPTTVEAILNGSQPRGLGLAHLLEPFPLEWTEQAVHWDKAAASP
ncbi:hypothetical protein SAMN02983003_2037 [Devosia enhydra]|uniref:Bacteriophage-related protein n=1 Tax=Devosia enhydra TaxID=665118 RepID=A0A1K2HY19_9HYPH|nr:hypothetical protein [Devosia enhydra]SFZ84486.1 hypothetical protein SAMN02983003_2037 [Devosia enhydra]